MRLDLAMNVKLGDKVYNTYKEVFYVVGKYETKNNIVFDISTLGNNITKVLYTEVYSSDLEGESDDEKSWVNWAKDNKDFLIKFENKQIEAIKQIYKTAFLNGFEYKRIVSYEEMMQK